MTEKQKDRKEQDRPETCFKTVINNWFASPILQDRKMKGKRVLGEQKKLSQVIKVKVIQKKNKKLWCLWGIIA